MSAISRSVRGVFAALAVLAAVFLAASSVGATGGGSDDAYRAVISPSGASAGTTSSLVITITQVSSTPSKKVHSVRVTAPSAIEITAATARKGNTDLTTTLSAGAVTVDDIPLNSSGQSATITLQAAIPCGVGGSRSWTVVARNASSFDDGGAALTQDSASQLTTGITRCSLAWEEQPASAGRGKVITSEIADPSGTPVKVRLLDGDGDPASQSGVTVTLAIVSGTGASGATLGGDTAEDTNANGVAAFAPTINTSERDYRLVATATGVIDSPSSSAFDINDVARVCSGTCSGSSDKDTTTATISASSNGGVLTMSLGLDSLDCNDAANDYYESVSVPLTWDITPANGRTEITIRLDASDVTRPYNLYDVCFSSPESTFNNRYNVRIPKGGAGLLKICPPRLGKQDDDPCVVDKWRENGDVLIKFSVPPGDPRGRI